MKLFRTILAFRLSLACVLMLAGCGGAAQTSEETTEPTTEEATEQDVVSEAIALALTAEQVYYVGGDSEYQSLSALCLELEKDFNKKVIYLNPGTYDIYAEYRALNMETPPDDVASSDYMDRCVFLPANTYLKGIGDVTLLWNPNPEDITLGESRTWSPLNVRYGCIVENITIQCKYGRYCIHDDSHNHGLDQGTRHVYKNVRCVYEYSDQKKGFNNTIGFGFSQRSEYYFEDCTFEMKNCPPGDPHHSAFYGHAASGDSLMREEGPKIVVRNCELLGGKANKRTARLQCLNTCPLHVETLFTDCKIEGGLELQLYTDNAMQAFDVTLRNSGNPMVLCTGKNPYPVNVEK